MSTFKYRLTDGQEYLQDADEWEIIEEEYENDRGDSGVVKLVVFRESGAIIYRVPYLFVEKVTEIA